MGPWWGFFGRYQTTRAVPCFSCTLPPQLSIRWSSFGDSGLCSVVRGCAIHFPVAAFFRPKTIPESPQCPMYNFPFLKNAQLAVVPAVDGSPLDVRGHLSERSWKQILYQRHDQRFGGHHDGEYKQCGQGFSFSVQRALKQLSFLPSLLLCALKFPVAEKSTIRDTSP